MEGENTPQFRKTKIRRAKKPLHLLPQEIIEEILSKLPVKSLLRFRCVSKSWRSSIDSRFFINKRLRKSTQRGVIYNYTINDPNNNHLMIGSTVVGSCNGLLCILKEKSFFLWNPSIRFSIELPKIDLQTTKYGFGWDEENDAYKVFALVSQQNQNQCMGKVYSSRTNSWKTVEHGCLSLSRSLGVFACGKIHWLTKTGREIESFDLKSDVFGMMEGPCDWGFRTWVQERDGCLSVLCDYNRTRLDSWVMKKYGVKESWVLQNTRKAVNYKVKSLKTVKNYIESLVRPVCSSRQDEIEQEQIHAIHVAEGRPKPAPVRQNKRRAAGCGVKVTQESEEIVEEQVCTSVAEGRPKRQHRRRPTRYGDQGTKENPEIEKEQVHSTRVNKDRPKSQDERKEMVQEQVRASIAEGRPKRQNRRRPARYDT